MKPIKTSTFLTKVLNRFHNGKSYTTDPAAHTWGGNYLQFSRQYADMVPATAKGRNNLLGMIDKVNTELGGGFKGKAQIAIAQSLGHANIAGFQNRGFSKVKPVLKAAIKRARANGN